MKPKTCYTVCLWCAEVGGRRRDGTIAAVKNLETSHRRTTTASNVEIRSAALNKLYKGNWPCKTRAAYTACGCSLSVQPPTPKGSPENYSDHHRDPPSHPHQDPRLVADT